MEARTYSSRINISPKHAVEICSAIRGKRLERAKSFLKNVIEKKEFIPFKRYKKQIPHRKGGIPGRYPVKATKTILKLLENAENNADQKGMDTKKLFISSASTSLGSRYSRRASKGRLRSSDIQTTNIEIILTER